MANTRPTRPPNKAQVFDSTRYVYSICPRTHCLISHVSIQRTTQSSSPTLSTGVSPTLGLYDIYSIESPELLGFAPRPAYTLIFICPAVVYFHAKAENDAMKEYEGSGNVEPVVWYKQTIRHSCGLMGLRML